jgi:hypothetical protein
MERKEKLEEARELFKGGFSGSVLVHLTSDEFEEAVRLEQLLAGKIRRRHVHGERGSVHRMNVNFNLAKHLARTAATGHCRALAIF